MLSKENIRLGISPITWSNDQRPSIGENIPFEQCISEIALTGYEGTELGRKFPADPAELKKYLDLRNLTLCNAWFSSYLTTSEYKEVEKDFIEKRDFLYSVGARIIGVSEQGLSVQDLPDINIFDVKPVFDDVQWTKLTEGLNKLGKLAAEKDMIIAFHHHMSTGVQTLEEIDRLMEGTDPTLVHLLYDTGHLQLADVDCLRILEKHMDRIKHIHLKDIREDKYLKAKKDGFSFLDCVDKGVFTVPGDGMIDFKSIFKVLEEKNYSGWMIVEAEQYPDIANPFIYATKAREYIKAIANI